MAMGIRETLRCRRRSGRARSSPAMGTSREKSRASIGSLRRDLSQNSDKGIRGVVARPV